MGGLSLAQGIFSTQGPNPGLLHYRQILYCGATGEAQEYWTGKTIPSPADVPDPGIEQGSPAFQANSLPTELSGKSLIKYLMGEKAGYKPLRRGSPCGSVAKNPGRPGFHSWAGKISCRRKRQPTPVCLPEEFHEHRSQVGYSPWAHKESDTTERLR